MTRASRGGVPRVGGRPGQRRECRPARDRCSTCRCRRGSGRRAEPAPARERDDVEVVPHLVPLDDQERLDAEDLGRGRHSHHVAARGRGPPRSPAAPIRIELRTPASISQLARVDLPGVTRLLANRRRSRRRDRVEALAEVGHHMVVVEGCSVAGVERRGGPADENGVRDTLLEHRRRFEDTEGDRTRARRSAHRCSRARPVSLTSHRDVITTDNL